MKQQNTTKTLESVKEYYGKILNSNKDLQTSACCTAEAIPAYLRPLVGEIHPEVSDRFYGCGSPFPLELEGKTVLDLGCGSGRDCFMLSKLVGPTGKVIGIDMTDEQLAVARKHTEFHAQKFGYRTSNTEFKKGYIEDLESAGIQTNSVDIVISNCVLNLSPDKRRVFSEIFRVLKPGGELYFSDVFSDRRIPQPLTVDPVLLGECLGGALYVEDFRRLLIDLGVPDYRVVSRAPLSITNAKIQAQVGLINFYSITVRAFKLADVEDRCEDYGQVAYYKGTIPEAPHAFMLDDHHTFNKGMPLLVCSNTASMLKNTRYSQHFVIVGDTNTHFGLFDCAPSSPMKDSLNPNVGACC